jgi:hypothetical protein
VGVSISEAEAEEAADADADAFTAAAVEKDRAGLLDSDMFPHTLNPMLLICASKEPTVAAGFDISLCKLDKTRH